MISTTSKNWLSRLSVSVTTVANFSVSEVTLLGEAFLRIDFPDEDHAPEFYRPSAAAGILPISSSVPVTSHAAAGHYIEDDDGEGYDLYE